MTRHVRDTWAAAAGILFAFAADTALAECSGEWCWTVHVQQLYVQETGTHWVQTTGTESALSCTVDSAIFLQLPVSTGQRDILATLLAAQQADKTVSIRIVAGSAPCRIAYVLLDK